MNDSVPFLSFLNIGIMQTSSEAREMSLLYEQFRPGWNEEYDGQLHTSNLLPEIVEQPLPINGRAVGWYKFDARKCGCRAELVKVFH